MVSLIVLYNAMLSVVLNLFLFMDFTGIAAEIPEDLYSLIKKAVANRSTWQET